jgi:hypothetical protein
MNSAAEAALLDLYENLRGVYVGSGHKYVGGSVFLGLLAMGSKTRRMRVLLDAAVSASALGSSGSELVALGLADHAGADHRITLSAKGIWEAEQSRSILDSAGLLAYIDEKWFNCFAESKSAPTDKEKLILFTLLAARAFSPETGVKLSRKQTHRAWIELVLSASDFLRSYDIIGDIGAEEALRPGSAGTGPPPVVKFFRHTDDLPKKTDGIFIAKQLNYYLDLDSEGVIDKGRLAHLFGVLLEEKADFTTAEAFGSFCRDRAYDIAVQVLPPNAPTFASLEFDRLVDSALRESVLKA